MNHNLKKDSVNSNCVFQNFLPAYTLICCALTWFLGVESFLYLGHLTRWSHLDLNDIHVHVNVHYEDMIDHCGYTVTVTTYSCKQL